MESVKLSGKYCDRFKIVRQWSFSNFLRIFKIGRRGSGPIIGIKVLHLKKVYPHYKKIAELEIKGEE